jgi:hypothetical protein
VVKADVKEEARSGEIVENELTFPDHRKWNSNGRWKQMDWSMSECLVGIFKISDNNVGVLEKDITTISWNGECPE